MLCAITGIAGKPDGTVYASATFIIYRAPMSVVAQDGRVVAPIVASVVSEADGSVALSLLSGNYVGVETASKVTFPFTVPETATADWADCVELAPSVITPTFPASQLTGTLAAAQEPAHTGDVTNAAGSLTLTIAADAVTNAKLANMATARIKGRSTAGTGDPEDLTAAQAKAVLAIAGADVTMTGGGTAQDYVGFATRAAFVTWASGKTPPIGSRASWPGCVVRYTGGSTGITSALGWVHDDLAYPEHWGAAGDGVTNDRSALNSAVGVAAAVGRQVVLRGRYLCDTALTVNAGASLIGRRVAWDSTNRPGWNTYGSALIMNPVAPLTVGNGAGVQNILVIAKGLDATTVTQAVADAYTGVGIDAAFSGVTLKNVTILGFERGVDNPATNTARLRFHDLMIDCLNGVRIRNDLGGPELVRIRCEPILTGDDANNRRSGIGIELDGTDVAGIAGVDGPVMTDCFTFNDYGFKMTNMNAMKAKGCMSDGPRSVSEGIGLQILGTSTEHSYENFRAASKRGGVLVDTLRDDGNPCVHHFTNLNCWQNRDYGLMVTQGHVFLNGGRIARSPASYHDVADDGYGIVADGPEAIVYVDGMEFTAIKVALRAVNGGVIYYGPNCRFGEDIDLLFEGNVRPWKTEARMLPSSVTTKPRFFPTTVTPGSGTLALVADKLTFWPIALPHGYQPDRLEWEVTTGAAGTARVGIYGHDPVTNGPGGLLFDSGDVSVAAAAVQTITVTTPPLQDATLVWVALHLSIGCTVRAGANAGNGIVGGTSLTSPSAGYTVLTPYAALPADAAVLSLALTGDRALTALYKS